jgi:hypothetical protein
MHVLHIEVKLQSGIGAMNGKFNSIKIHRINSVKIIYLNLFFFLILDIPFRMYVQKYILVLSVVQSQPTHITTS